MSTQINASPRTDTGKGSSRRLRRQNQIPSIVYGAGKQPTMITLNTFEINALLTDQNVFTRIMELDIDGQKERVVIKDLQRHPAKRTVSHIDFLRVTDTQKIMRIPINFTNQENSKVLRIGAILNRFLSTVEVSCLAKDLPETLDVDVSRLKVGQSLRLSHIKMPPGVNILALTHGDIEAYDQTVVSVSKARKMSDVDFDDEDTGAEAVEGAKGEDGTQNAAKEDGST